MQRHYANWQYGLIFFVLLLSLVYALPNIYGDDPALIIQHKGKLIDATQTTNIQNILQKDKIAYLGLENKNKRLIFRFESTDQQIQARDHLKKSLDSETYQLALNLLPRTPAWLQAIGASPMKLGLDLRGGVHFLLDVDADSVIKARIEGDFSTLKKTLREDRIRYTSLKVKNSLIHIQFLNKQDQDKALALVYKALPDYQIKAPASNHAKKPARLTLELKPKAVTNMTNYTIDQTITILNNRINELGVSEAGIQRQGLRQVAVDLPGVQDPARAKEILGKTATLRFQMVDDQHDANQIARTGITPPGSQLYYYKGGFPVLLHSNPILTGRSITFATATIQEGRPAVSIRLGGGGESLFHRTTASNVGKSMAVVYVETELKKFLSAGKWQSKRIYHEKLISVATIQSALGNQFVISNLHNQSYAENLALLLRSGALAAPVNIVQELTVGSTLGPANIAKGVRSLLAGSMLVILFMLAYYRLFGLIANVALFFNVILIIAALSLIDATLTLPGIAGIVLTVGMAVDANVLINERIREEYRRGVPAIMAIEAGYEKAFATIVDANVTTLIVAMVLFSLGSGSVKGFAITLSIGLLASMMTSVSLTRAIVDLIVRDPKTQHISIGIPKPENQNLQTVKGV
jgi:preprotein translocase subunit SecD